jgi:hypothetical protein
MGCCGTMLRKTLAFTLSILATAVGITIICILSLHLYKVEVSVVGQGIVMQDVCLLVRWRLP